MNKETFISTLREPNHKNLDLNGIIDAFPYFQTAHILHAKVKKSEGHHLSDAFIRSASLYSADRSQLYVLLNKKEESTAQVITKDIISNIGFQDETIAPDIPESVAPSPLLHTEISEKVEMQPFVKEDSTKQRTSGIMDEVLANLQALRDAKNLAKSSFDSVIEFDGSNVRNAEKIESLPIIPSGSSNSSEKKLQYKINTFVTPVDYKNQELQDGRLGESTGSHGQLDILQNYLAYLKKDKSIVLEEQLSVIESFIKRNPSISKPTEAGLSQHKIDFSQKSSKESAELVTENLANIFIKQKKFSKAIEIYQKLSLKYPEKSTYFAQKITELQNL